MDFVTFAETFGLPIALLIFAILTGAGGWWYYKSYVVELKALFKERLDEINTTHAAMIVEKNAQAERWQKVAEANGAIAQANAATAAATLELNRKMSTKLDRVQEELRSVRQMLEARSERTT